MQGLYLRLSHPIAGNLLQRFLLMARFSPHQMHGRGAAQWQSLPRGELPDAPVEMALMQIVVSSGQLPDGRKWCSDFRTENAGTPGIEFACIWDVEISHTANPPGLSALHILSMYLPFSLIGKSLQAYQQQRASGTLGA